MYSLIHKVDFNKKTAIVDLDNTVFLNPHSWDEIGKNLKLLADLEPHPGMLKVFELAKRDPNLQFIAATSRSYEIALYTVEAIIKRNLPIVKVYYRSTSFKEVPSLDIHIGVKLGAVEKYKAVEFYEDRKDVLAFVLSGAIKANIPLKCFQVSDEVSLFGSNL